MQTLYRPGFREYDILDDRVGYARYEAVLKHLPSDELAKIVETWNGASILRRCMYSLNPFFGNKRDSAQVAINILAGKMLKREER